MVLQPLSQILVFTLVFSQVMRSRIPGLDGSFGYSIFLCAGLLTWGFFADLVGRYQNMFLENANLIKKINFPRICIPVIALFNAGINFIIIASLFIGFTLLVGSFPGGVLILIVPVLLLQTTLAMGLGMTIGVLNVFFRDIGHLFAIVLQFWFWLTPIVYPLQSLPVWAQEIVNLNPMTPLITAYQSIVVQGEPPLWTSLMPSCIFACLFCLSGMYLFKIRAGEMIDEL
jgi:lipopolysaccharide transport system permease protein